MLPAGPGGGAGCRRTSDSTARRARLPPAPARRPTAIAVGRSRAPAPPGPPREPRTDLAC